MHLYANACFGTDEISLGGFGMTRHHNARTTAREDIRESRRNRKVAIIAIVASMISAFGAAWITAHSAPVIRVLGSRTIIEQINVGARALSRSGGSGSRGDSSSGGPAGGRTGDAGLALPGGAAFAKRSFEIGSNGIDLDRNPPEQGNLTNGQIEVQADSPEILDFRSTQEVFQWNQPGLPTQEQCHSAELRDGQQDPNVDLTTTQQSHGTARFCILTSEGRDAFMVISGAQVRSGEDIPAAAIVWSRIIPVQ